MGIIDRFLKKKVAEAPSGEEFGPQLNESLNRYNKVTAGSLEAEATSIAERLRKVESVESRDIADLVAMTQVLVHRFNKNSLKQWTGFTTIEDIWPELEKQLMVEEHERDALPISNWFRDLKKATRDIHNAEISQDAYGWLVEWRPSEPGLHLVKMKALQNTNLGILADMLMTLVNREIELVEMPPEAVPDDVDYVYHEQNELWQCITETRVMRHAVEEAMVASDELPTDYKQAIDGEKPEVQLAFLVDHQEYFDEIKSRAP